MSEKGWGVVQDDEVDERRRHHAPETSRKLPYRLPPLGAGGIEVEEDADIEIAVFACTTARTASEEEGQPDLTVIAQGVPQALDERIDSRGGHPENGNSGSARKQDTYGR
jgi:hypothetical protein